MKVVQQMLGHASAAMMLDVYAGLFADNLDELADRLDEVIEKAAADQVRTIEPNPTVASFDYHRAHAAD